MSKSEMYVEAFIESELGYRWRFYDRDAISAVTIVYQEWDEKAKTWITRQDANEITFGFDDIEAACAAMKAVRDNAPKG